MERHPEHEIREMSMTRLLFLGTGGGRFVTLTQERSTGGILIDDGPRLHIDPGPGALSALRRNRVNPKDLDAILISHCHPDHYANAEVLIEGISSFRSGRKRALLASHSVIKGRGEIGPAISKYHLNKLDLVRTMKGGDIQEIKGVKITATPSIHSDPDTIGFKISTSSGDISYVADTELRDGIVDLHKGARILILSTTRPLRARIPHHLSTEDAAYFAECIRPDLVILTHLGKRFLKDDPNYQAGWVHNKTGIETIAAIDNMLVTIGEDIGISSGTGDNGQ